MTPIQSPITLELTIKAQEDLLRIQDPAVKKAALKAFRLIPNLTLVDLRAHPGLNFHKLHGYEQASGREVYSLRITQKARALCLLDPGPTLKVILISEDHDKAYRGI